jgi:hypothetical protein
VEQRRIWHVRLTVGGTPTDSGEVRSALDRLAAEQPFLLAARYGDDRVELDYWEEAEGCGDAAALALRLWGEHRVTAGLPPWEVLGLEVVERETFAQRESGTAPVVLLAPAGQPRTGRLRALPS